MNYFDKLKEHILNIDIIGYIINNFFSLVIVILIIVFYKQLTNTISRLLKKIFHRFFKDEGIISFFVSISNVTVHIIFFFIILKLLGIDLKGIFALIGALSLVLGFAFKETIGNICGGLILLTFRPFKIGDFIEFKTFIGTVTKIEIFYTTILNPQNEYVIVPNGNLINNEIRNININKARRLDLQVGVSYDVDVDKVKEIFYKIIEGKKEELFNLDFAEPLIGLFEIGNSKLNFDIRVYVKEGMILKARYYLFEKIKEEFEKNNIVLPYEKLDIKINER